MLKNKKILIVLAIALVCLIAATLMIVSFLTPVRTTFYVFKSDYKAGTAITSSMLTPIQADSRVVIGLGNNTGASAYFITKDNLNKSVTAGDVLRVDVKEGEPFMLNHVSKYGNNEIEVKMSPNAVAITIPANNLSGVTAELKSESHVNVYVSFDGETPQALLEDVRVLSVAKSDDATLQGVTLELDKSEAPNIIQAIKYGGIYLGLINPDGYIFDNPKN